MNAINIYAIKNEIEQSAPPALWALLRRAWLRPAHDAAPVKKVGPPPGRGEP